MGKDMEVTTDEIAVLRCAWALIATLGHEAQLRITDYLKSRVEEGPLKTRTERGVGHE